MGINQEVLSTQRLRSGYVVAAQEMTATVGPEAGRPARYITIFSADNRFCFVTMDGETDAVDELIAALTVAKQAVNARARSAVANG